MTETDCNIAKLSDRGVLRVHGPDAKRFLQGIVTNDMERVGGKSAVHAGLLTPQGKILFDFFVVGEPPDFLLDCPSALAGELAKRLTFYKLRSALEIEDVSDTHAVAAAWGGTPVCPQRAVLYPDPRLAALGHRLVLEAGGELSATGCATAPEAAYHAHRIALGVPEGGKDFDYGDAFPHEADFDELNGVDFAKGCYVGQEVVSRMEHRGTARKRVVPVEGEVALPEGGAEIQAADAAIGRLGSVADKAGLALLRLDRAEKAQSEGKTITAGGVVLRLRQPVWASFAVAGKGD